MTSSCVGPSTKSFVWRSLKRNNSGPYCSKRPDSSHSAAGCVTGIKTSNAPERFISSRTIASTFFRTRVPMGNQEYKPEANLRIIPARNIS